MDVEATMVWIVGGLFLAALVGLGLILLLPPPGMTEFERDKFWTQP